MTRFNVVQTKFLKTRGINQRCHFCLIHPIPSGAGGRVFTRIQSLRYFLCENGDIGYNGIDQCAFSSSRFTDNRNLAAFGNLTLAAANLTDAADAARLALAKAVDLHAGLAANAPDLAQAEAAMSRAASVVKGADQDIATFSQERAGLDREIDLRSGEGVAEDLADVSARLSAAQAQRDRLLFEVAVLKDLIAALESARDTARERYFAPVMAELKPLLRLLWPDAELMFDGESLLPTALVRNGLAEDIGILSGGTQEQIALFVRLAFARLLAKTGRHAPIILDDALVFTDDDRIERVFDALHGQANDLQIIVLSCRQRAFRDLGGHKLTFVPVQDRAALP